MVCRGSGPNPNNEGNVKSSKPVAFRNPAHAHQRKKCSAATNVALVTRRHRQTRWAKATRSTLFAFFIQELKCFDHPFIHILVAMLERMFCTIISSTFESF